MESAFYESFIGASRSRNKWPSVDRDAGSSADERRRRCGELASNRLNSKDNAASGRDEKFELKLENLDSCASFFPLNTKLADSDGIGG